jgi:hypothetical protein
MNARIIVAALILGLASAAYFAFSDRQPSTFDDCILKYVPGTKDELAATMIYQSCSAKFGRSAAGPTKR